jgi:hypothetical protein|tara:strand:- start:307 stop:540 length:234 start_codon:yes stop_codon:yes gene_type:complete
MYYLKRIAIKLYIIYLKFWVRWHIDKYNFSVIVWFPIKKFVRAVGFMFTLRIKEKLPLRLGWYLAQDIKRKVDSNEL